LVGHLNLKEFSEKEKQLYLDSDFCQRKIKVTEKEKEFLQNRLNNI
jgi:hypothetical protein